MSAGRKRAVAVLLVILSTVAATRDLWFHTGDLARRDADGWFWFVGRRTEAIIAAVRAKNRLHRAQKRAAVLRAKRARKRYRVIVNEVIVPAPSVSISPYDLCGPVRGGGPLSKRERKRRRRQALYYLNLHC